MYTKRVAVFLFIIFLVTAGLRSAPPDGQITVTGQIEFGASKKRDSSNAVVWFTPVGDRVRTRTGNQRGQLLQKHKTFSPHVLVVRVGSSVDFPNQDPFFHNVFSLFEGKRFDLGLYEAGTNRTVTFNRVGVSYIFCNIHPEMSAVVISLNTPFYGISDRNGMISIPDVPAGLYEMGVWDERVLPETLYSLTRRILVSQQSSSLGVLHLPEQRNLSHMHKNKYGQDYDPSNRPPGYIRP